MVFDKNMFFELIYILQWWVIFFVIGFSFLPLTFTIFKNFFDKGYIFSKILGIAIVSYAIFLLGILHIAPFSFLTSLLILIFFGVLNLPLIFSFKDGKTRIKEDFLKILKENWPIFLFEEILFIFGLLSWSYIRSFQPDIHGLEKYMDFGILNSILRSEFFPPKDMWFTPLPINYYYFGHLTTAVLTKLSNIPSNITFNLMIATIFAFTFAGSFSIGANLIHKLNAKRYMLFAGGLLTAFIVSFAGNLQTIYAFFKNYSGENPVPFWHLPLSIQFFPNMYWYPNATRFIHNTIHEFPLYSFVVSDLHGHVLDIPIVLLTIALLLSVIQNSKGKIQNYNAKIKTFNFELKFFTFNFSLLTLLLISFLLAVAYTTNAWDGIIYGLLTAIVFSYLAFRSKNYSLYAKRYALIVIGSIIFAYPFNHFFKPFVSGVGVVCPPDFLVKAQKLGPFIFEADHCQKSPWWQIMILYGFFYFWVVSFIVFFYRSVILRAKPEGSKILHFAQNDIMKSDLFVLLLIVLSTLLIIVPEFIYVKDIYPAHYRANTMFKLVYQSFIMLSIASSYIIIRIVLGIKYYVSSTNPRKKIITACYLLFATFLLALVFIYPYFAIGSFYGGLKTQLGLDGTKYLKNLYPTDYDAIAWINKNIKGQPVILEAQGDSYTDFARVSANTGLPTVLGWTVHEWLWRGTYDIPAPRIPQVQMLYESSDINITKELIDKYKIEYVFIGDLEYQKYTNLNEQKFETIGKIIYKNGRTKIYKITQQ